MCVKNTAEAVAKHLKDMPKTGKRRNIFIKTYNRRPQSRKKANNVLALVSMTQMMGAAQLMSIMSQPIPKNNEIHPGSHSL